MFFKIDNPEMKQMLEEISALSGMSKDVVREVWEYTFFRWAEKISRTPDQRVELIIPFLGKLCVKYEKDIVKEDGTLDTEVSAVVALDPFFRQAVGDIHDEGPSVVEKILEEKIDNSLLTIIADAEFK